MEVQLFAPNGKKIADGVGHTFGISINVPRDAVRGEYKLFAHCYYSILDPAVATAGPVIVTVAGAPISLPSRAPESVPAQLPRTG